MAKQQQSNAATLQASSRVELALSLGLSAWIICLHIVNMLHAGPLWRDECGTIAYANMPFGEMWDKVQYDNFSPFFEWIARVWTLVISPADFGYRVLGLIVGVGTLAVIWASARLLGARTPLFALALYALNPLALRVGDSIRPYGLGFALDMLTLGFIWKFVQVGTTRWFIAATIAAALSVQCLYQSAFYIAAFVLAGCGVSLWKKNRKAALYCLVIGGTAALLLLVHVPNIQKGEQWRDIARVPVSKELIGGAISELLTAAAKFMQPVYIAVFAATLGLGVFAAVKWKSSNVVYATAVFLLATIFQIGFLTQVGLPPRSWYFLIWLAPMMICADVTWSAFKTPVQITRALLVTAIAVLCVPSCWSGSKLRQTNIDLIAAKLKTERKPEDMVLVAPWFYGVSLNRYYPQDQFTTLPPMEEIRIHRYDLMKRAMQSADPIGPLANRIVETLRGGHTLWIVGSLKFPAAGETVRQYPPYYKGIGNNDAAYYFSWSEALGKLVQEHATKGDVVSLPTPAIINSVENTT
ncbi:MAG: glycosyltransferase family 39 protein, partial [Limisphaerales bacterium]